MAFAFSRIGLRIAVPAVIVALGLVGALVYVQRRDDLRQDSERRDVYADLMSRMILADVHDALQANDPPRIQRALTRFAELPPLKALRIVGNSGKVVFASDPAVLGTVMAKTDPSCLACHEPGAPTQTGSRTLRLDTANGGHLYRAAQPIALEEACTRCHDQPTGATLGVLMTDLDDDALAGAPANNSRRTLWAAMAGMLLLFGLLAALLGRNVVFRLRHLRHLLDLLRTGARATVLSVGAADEIDDVTRAVQALTLDLDGRIGLERATRRLAAVLERQTGPVLLIDSRGWIVAANRLASTRFGREGTTLAGCRAEQIPGVRAEQLAAAREQGWALPDADVQGPAFLALQDPSATLCAVLALWGAQEPALHALDSSGIGVAEQPAWQLFCAVLAESSVPVQHHHGAKVLRFDARLAHVRRLAHDLAIMGRDALAEREQVDLKSLAIILLWDLKREFSSVRWHTLAETTTQTYGARYQLRELLQRLARAAAQQAGADGHVVLFAHETDGEVFLAAWASQPGGQIVLDPADAPAIARAVAVAHGGGVEVDPHFDLSETPGFSNLKMPIASLGTLYVAQLAVVAPGEPLVRLWHEPTIHA